MPRRRRSEHFATSVNGWPAFTPEILTPAEQAQRDEFDTLAHRYIGKRFAGDPETRADIEELLFAPTIERPTYYGQSTYQRSAS